MTNLDVEEEGLFKYRRKILLAKILFATGVGTIGVLAGFKMGFSKSHKKYGGSKVGVEKGMEEPVKFASRALRRASLITLGCFAFGVGCIFIAFGVTSPDDLRQLSRKKHTPIVLKSDNEVSDKEISDDEFNNEVISDKALELTDKWK